MGKTREDKGSFSKVCWCRFLCCHIWADASLELSPVIKNHSAFLRRIEDGREFFLVSAFFQLPSVKLILIPAWHILGWQSLDILIK